MEREISDILSKIDERSLFIRAGSSFNWNEDVTGDVKSLVCYCAMHCIYNGPVGVNKTTSWPSREGSFSIKQLIPTISNSKWKYFCSIVEKLLILGNNSFVKDCYTYSNFGSTWPSCEGSFKPKTKV
jgi:hypothetical protein